MVRLAELVRYCDTLLNASAFQDYSPNGLQVEGRDEIRVLVSGVTASQALIDTAIAHQADAVLVHHGFFWKGEERRVVGARAARLKALLGAEVSLIGYHLPLDAHAEFGNNARLASLLGLTIDGHFGPTELGLFGRLPEPVSSTELVALLSNRLGREPLHIPGGPEPIRRIGWCTGAAQGYLDEAATLGLDAYISGEISEHTVHTARESQIHYFAAGHHATERYGVAALGDHLAEHFGICHEYVEIPNPV